MDKIRPVKYSQHDSKWGKENYSTKGEKKTISQEGCGPASVAMLLATFVDKKITPKTCCDWSMAHGGKALNQGTYYSYFAKQFAAYGIECEQLNYKNLQKEGFTSYAKDIHKKALEYLKKGYYLICCMGPGNWTTSGHFIVWYDVKNNNALVNDPNSFRMAQEQASISKLQREVKYYFVVKINGYEEDEMVTKEKIKFFGKEIECELIRKDGKVYPYIRDFGEKAGLKISNEGKMPVVEK